VATGSGGVEGEVPEGVATGSVMVEVAKAVAAVEAEEAAAWVAEVTATGKGRRSRCHTSQGTHDGSKPQWLM